MSLESVRLALPFIAAGQAQKEVTHNEALALIDAAIGAAVETVGLDLPPASPLAGQCWIIGSAPSSAWADHPNALACWTESGWRFLPALEGMAVWAKDEQLWAVRGAGGWTVGAVRAAYLEIAGQQVVGARQSAVSAPTGGPVVDAEARTAIADIIVRLTAHGLIES